MDGLSQQQQLPNIKRWVVVYPVYIDSKKTLAEGRRISVAKACAEPQCPEIVACCNYLKIPSFLEPEKAYPRDFMQKGRVRVLLKKEDGTLFNPSIRSRKQLMLHLAELIPRYSGRLKKQEASSSTSTAGQAKQSTSTTGQAKQSTSGQSKPSSSGGSSKSGRKKKK